MQEQRWPQLIGIGVPLFGTVGAFMALSNDPTSKFILVFLLLVAAGLLAKSAVDDLRKPAASVPAPALPRSLEGIENPALLADAGYHRTSYPGRWERDVPDADANFEEKDVIVYENGAWIVSGNVYVVLNECAWAPNSAKVFQYRNGGGCSIKTLLSQPKFRERLLLARHLVFVGLESHLSAPRPAADKSVCGHDWLTECRSEELATQVRNAFPAGAPAEPKYWVLNIGHARTKSPNIEWDQRRAVILGIRNRRDGLSVEDAISRISRQTKVGEVPFDNYSEASSAVATSIVWKKGSGTSPHR